MPIIIKQTNQYIHIVMLFAHLLFQIYTHSLCILTHDMDTSHNAIVEPCVTVNEMFPGIFTFPATLGSYDTRIVNTKDESDKCLWCNWFEYNCTHISQTNKLWTRLQCLASSTNCSVTMHVDSPRREKVILAVRASF